MKPFIFVGILAVATPWAFAQDQQRSNAATREEKILANMPVNVEHRCLGISLVTACLIEGEASSDDNCDTLEELSRQIFDAAFTKARVRFSFTLCVGSRRLTMTSREALNALSIAVYDLYKDRHLAQASTPAGAQKIRNAERNTLRTRRALEELLDADTDHIVPFALLGDRRFPDGEVKDSSHAALIAKQADGEIVVYDSNDPGRPIPCRLEPSSDGILIEWTCGYKDPAVVTTQQYRIIEIDRFFREALARH